MGSQRVRHDSKKFIKRIILYDSIIFETFISVLCEIMECL